jgi:Holliday junction resolvase RusA-like endonuclease
VSDLDLLRRIFTGEEGREGEEALPSLTFVVYGHPEPAGSKRIVRRGGTGPPIIVDDNPKSSAWKKKVRAVAEGVRALVEYPMLEGPVACRVRFLRARPKGHYDRKGRLLPDAPEFPIVRPDTLKLMRAVEDALTGALYGDDAQIVEQHVSKAYGELEGVEVTVWPKSRKR